MQQALFNDGLDDAPDKVEAASFLGMDALQAPANLVPQIVQGGANMWADADGLLQTRPGTHFNSKLTRATYGANPIIRGMGYYDTPAAERVLAAGDGKLYEITSAGNGATANVLTPALAPSKTAPCYFSQLIDRMFWCDGVLHWSQLSGTWTHGTVTQFSNTAAMPVWGAICSHVFRMLAIDPATGKIYASAVGAADTAAGWVQTENLRVGSGEGDPPRRLISAQGGYLVVLCESSAWLVDTSNPSVGNWSAVRLTGLAGCNAPFTAVQSGQDVMFLSQLGVLSLGALQTTDSINAALTISGPIKPYIDRINPAALGAAWAVQWRDLYLLALPIDTATVPNIILGYNRTLRQWTSPWIIANESITVPAALTSTGFAAGVVTNFGGQQETLLADDIGRVVRLDRDYEKDELTTGAAVEIESWATTKAFTHDIPEYLKQPFGVEVEFYNSTARNVQLNLVRDGRLAFPDLALGDCEVIAAGLATNALKTFPIKFPIEFAANRSYIKTFHVRNLPRYRKAALQIYSEAGRMKVRVMRLSAFIDTPILNQ